jgi:hypothetical protein
MKRDPVSDPELAALGEFQGTIDRNANLRQQVTNHNLGRNIRVAKLLGFLALMRQRGTALKGIVECVAAIKQNFSSSKSMTHMGMPTGPMEAAHFLPGQVQIGRKKVWQFATNPATSSQIEFLFAEVEHLPVFFNQADSAAEAKRLDDGLCSGLARGCTTLLGRQMVTAAAAGKISLDLLRPAYEDWHQDALAAINNAIARKSAKPGIPALVGDPFEGYTAESITARSAASAKLTNRDNSLSVLRYYLEDQQQRGWPWVLGPCQPALREVEFQFKG